MTELRWKLAGDRGGQGVFFSDDELVERHVGRGVYRGMEFLHVNASRIVNELPNSSRMPFRFTINAYRGCSHACVYCFARPTHAYLGLNSGDDFDTKLVVKVNAVERLRAELRAPRRRGDAIAMGTNTDPYQRCEARYHLTRGLIEVLTEAANPFSILTKSTLILRDIALLRAAAERTTVRANLSVATLDEAVWKATEPGTPHPRRRVEAVAKLNAAGVPCGVLIAPVLPGLSDRRDQLTEVVEACVAARAVSITALPLHLRPGVRDHFLSWLAGARPELVEDYRRRYRRAYLPGREQDDVTSLVRRLVAAARRRHPRPDSRPRVAPPRGADRAGSCGQASLAPPARQLDLGV